MNKTQFIVMIASQQGTAPAWTPLSLPGLQAWFDATTPVYSDTGKTTLATTDETKAAVWPDLSGNGRDLIRKTSDTWGPKLRTNTYNAKTKRALRFTPNASAMLTTATWDAFPNKRGSVYIVQYSKSVNSSCFTFGGPLYFLAYNSHSVAPYKIYDDANHNAANFDPITNDLTVYSYIRSGNTVVDFYRDSVLDSHITVSNIQVSADKPLLVSAANSAGINADVCEIIVLDHASDAAEQATIEAYLLAKWKNPTRTPVWARQDAMSADAVWETDNIFEPTVLYEGNPQVLVGPTNVFKMWYTGGWTTPKIGYAESEDGINWTKYASNPVIASGARGCVVKVGAVYWLYILVGAGICLYTSNDGLTWALDTANVLTKTQAWETGSVNNMCVWQEGANDWRMLYEGIASGAPRYSTGYATSTDGKTWTKYASNPVILNASGPVVRKIGSTFWLWSHGCINQDGLVPSDIYRYRSTDCINWTQDPAGLPILSRVDVDEGVGFSGNGWSGQAADPWIMEVGGSCYLFYSGSADGSNQSGMQHVKVGVASGLTLAQLVTTQEGI